MTADGPGPEAVCEGIKVCLRQLPNLPTLPEIVVRLNELLENDATGAADIAGLLNDDPALAANMLRAANSAFYSGRWSAPLFSVRDAVARIGFREVRNLCLAMGVVNLFPDKGKTITHRALWEHSLVTAIAARAISRHASGSPDEDMCFVAGLLHEVGILILDQYFHRALADILHTVKSEGRPAGDVERELLGMDHAELGAELMGLWHMPEPVASSIRYHHVPEEADPACRPVARVVAAADLVCNRHGSKGCLEPADLDADDALLFTIPQEKQQELFAEIEACARKSEVFMAIALGGPSAADSGDRPHTHS